MFAIAVLVGLLTAFVSSVCTAVDEAHEANTGEESDACAINPLIYICAILDILAAATLFVFGYAVCCCTKDKDAQVAVAARALLAERMDEPGSPNVPPSTTGQVP